MPVLVGVSAAAATGTTTVTPAFPTAYTATDGDIECVAIESENTDTITPPGNGMAALTSQVVSTGIPTKLSLFWRRLAAGNTAGAFTASPGDHMIGRTAIIRGCRATGNPWNIFAGATEVVSDTTVSIPGLTTTAADCYVTAWFSTGRDLATVNATAWVNASLANFAEQIDNWAITGLGGGWAMAAGGKAAAGAVSATTATVSTADFKALIVVAFEGAADMSPRWSLNRSPRPSETMSAAGPYAPPSQSAIFGG
jgi:hypothetical protein